MELKNNNEKVGGQENRSYMYACRDRETDRETEIEIERNRIHISCRLPSLTFLFADVI